jgi:hypothetical protein
MGASLLVVVALACATASAAGRSARSLAAYSGLGAWVSIYDTPAWRDPWTTVDTLAQHGVHTLFLETGNYRQKMDVVRPAVVSDFIQLAHAAGIDIVAWYLPSLAAPARDLRRSLAAVDFQTDDGQSFDSFALDIEATVVREMPLRIARAVQLASRVRRAAPADYPLAAITIAPVGASPSYWPGYPFASLAQLVDVLLPMAYFTARTKGAARVREYTTANIAAIRDQIGDPRFPIHAIGGVTPRARPAEVGGFVQAASACSVVGASLWELTRTTPREWAQLARIALPPGGLARSAASDCS